VMRPARLVPADRSTSQALTAAGSSAGTPHLRGSKTRQHQGVATSWSCPSCTARLITLVSVIQAMA
jgi:hypothetical protein